MPGLLRLDCFRCPSGGIIDDLLGLLHEALVIFYDVGRYLTASPMHNHQLARCFLRHRRRRVLYKSSHNPNHLTKFLNYLSKPRACYGSPPKSIAMLGSMCVYSTRHGGQLKLCVKNNNPDANAIFSTKSCDAIKSGLLY